METLDCRSTLEKNDFLLRNSDSFGKGNRISSGFCMTMRHMTSQIILCFYCQMECEKCRAAELDLRQSTIVCFCWLPHNRAIVTPIVLRNVLRKLFSVIYIHKY